MIKATSARAGEPVILAERYWGAFCAQCNVWLRKSDNTLLYYPTPGLMGTDLCTDLDIPSVHFDRQHLFKVTEFGAEQAVNASEGELVCPVIVERRRQERYRALTLRGFHEDRISDA